MRWVGAALAAGVSLAVSTLFGFLGCLLWLAIEGHYPDDWAIWFWVGFSCAIAQEAFIKESKERSFERDGLGRRL